MAIYKHRRSFDADPVKPLAEEIEIGEIVINMANMTIWTKNDSLDVIQLTRTPDQIRQIVESDSDGAVLSTDIIGYDISDSDAAGLHPVIFIQRNGIRITTDITTRGTNFATPSADRDYTNKKYVDDEDTALETRLEARLESEISSIDLTISGSVIHESELAGLVKSDTELQSIVYESELVASIATTIRESDVTFDSDNIYIGDTTVARYTDAKARAAVIDDTLSNSPLVFTTNTGGDERKLTGFRDSDGTINVRSVELTEENGEDQFIITLVVFSPSFTPDGEGEAKLFWDIPALGTQNFSNPGVGVKVLVNGDAALNATTDPFISSIAGITATAGTVSAFNTLDISTSDTGSASATSYTLRAVVDNGESGSFFQPVSTTHLGGSVSGTVTFNQRIGSAAEAPYTGSINNNTWTLQWQDVGITFNISDGTYNNARDDNTFLKVYDFSDISYRSRPTGLSATNSSAATGAVVSIVSPDTDYVTLSVASSNDGELDGVIQFENPVDTETARAVTLNTTTSFTRPSAVTSSSYNTTRSDNNESISIPTFLYPRFFIITDRADNPAVANIINDSTTTGIDINIAATDSAVTDDIAPLGNTWVGTGSTGSIVVTVEQNTTIWFALPTLSNVTQPTNFERSVAGTFDAYTNVHGLRGLRPTAVTLDLIPDDVSDFSSGYTGQEYRFYGIDLGSGATTLRIY